MKMPACLIAIFFAIASSFSPVAHAEELAQPVAFYNGSGVSLTVYSNGSANIEGICNSTEISHFVLGGTEMTASSCGGPICSIPQKVGVEAFVTGPSTIGLEFQDGGTYQLKRGEVAVTHMACL